MFGNAVGEPLTTIKTAWRNSCRRAGIHDLHFHDLGREFACRLLESSADLHDERDFLGHANITTTLRTEYAGASGAGAGAEGSVSCDHRRR